MPTLTLTPAEADQVTLVVQRLAHAHGSTDNPALLATLNTLTANLPTRLRAYLHAFRALEPSHGVCLVRRLPLLDAFDELTPPHWQDCYGAGPARREQVMLALVTALVGDAFGWATQQDGRLIHHVMPVKAHAHEQLGTGSETELWWHTEDAFHPLRPDYVALMCLRNPDRVATTVASLEEITLAPEIVHWLCQPLYTILPDESHTPKHSAMLAGASTPITTPLYDAITRMAEEPEKIPVLFGAMDDPYIRVDPYFMPQVEPVDAWHALTMLRAEIDTHMKRLVLEPGDLVILDNYRVVHGRVAFTARFDGTDRWLLRTCLARDLRKSRAQRASTTSRIIGAVP